jgi:NADH:ubiquinone oxidoreductase subunit F (NADH-binding)
MVEILERFNQGEGSNKEIKDLEDLSSAMMLSSLCGLGQAAPNVIIDTLQHFRDAYESRVIGN